MHGHDSRGGAQREAGLTGARNCKPVLRCARDAPPFQEPQTRQGFFEGQATETALFHGEGVVFFGIELVFIVVFIVIFIVIFIVCITFIIFSIALLFAVRRGRHFGFLEILILTALVGIAPVNLVVFIRVLHHEPRGGRGRDDLSQRNLRVSAVRVVWGNETVPPQQLVVPQRAVRVEHLFPVLHVPYHYHFQHLGMLVVLQTHARPVRLDVVEHVPERNHGLSALVGLLVVVGVVGMLVAVVLVVHGNAPLERFLILIVILLAKRERKPSDKRGGVQVRFF